MNSISHMNTTLNNSVNQTINDATYLGLLDLGVNPQIAWDTAFGEGFDIVTDVEQLNDELV